VVAVLTTELVRRGARRHGNRTAVIAGEQSLTALQDAVRSALAGYKVPRSVHVVDSLPLSPVGKVLRRALREPLWVGEGARS
jgi:acyl-CoA synthetase (AMP-forming)/AMP-acid ligase II